MIEVNSNIENIDLSNISNGNKRKKIYLLTNGNYKHKIPTSQKNKEIIITENEKNEKNESTNEIDPIVLRRKDSFNGLVDEYNNLKGEKDNSSLFKEYGYVINEHLIKLEKNHINANCLMKHEISPILRARMVDWIIEVLYSFKANQRTFYRCISIMDSYLKETPTNQKFSELHLIGITCLFIASKIEDLNPLKMKIMVENISHNKLSIIQIKEKEEEILRSIGYFVHNPIILDFLLTYCKIVFFDILDESIVEDISIYISKMILHSYHFCNEPPSLIAVGSIFIAFKIYSKNRLCNVKEEEILSRIFNSTDIKEEQILAITKNMQKVINNFAYIFPSLNNLQKFHRNSIKF